MRIAEVNLRLVCFLLGGGACAVSCTSRVVPVEVRPQENQEATLDKPWIQPVILVHGFASTPAKSWGELDQVLAEDGHLVTAPQLPAYASVGERATELGQQIDLALEEAEELGYFAPKLHIIAHSMGGLDARYAISSLGYEDRVATLVTIATPHRGSPVADLALDSSDKITAFGVTDRAATAISRYWGLPDITEESARTALRDLTVERAREFNRANPDAVGVTYESWAGLSNPFASARPSDEKLCNVSDNFLPEERHRLPGRLLAPAVVAGGWFENVANDGVVPVASARWTGFSGCILSDHISITQTQTETFNSTSFFRAMVDRLNENSDRIDAG